MTNEAKKLFEKVQEYSKLASISEKTNSMGVTTNLIEMPCNISGKQVPARIFLEKHDFAEIKNSTLRGNEGKNPMHYETLTDGLVKKFGKKSNIGLLRLDQAA